MRLSSNGILHKTALWSNKLLPSLCSQHGKLFLQGRQAGKQKYVRICSPPLGQQDSYHYVLHIKQSAEQDSASWKRSSFMRWLQLNEMPTVVVCCLFPSAANRVMVKYISSIWYFPCYSWLWWNEDTLKPSGDNIPHFFRDVLSSRSMEKASSSREIALALSQKN